MPPMTPPSSYSPERAAPLPLSVLLSQVLITLTQEFAQAGAGTYPLPSLAVWSNALRCIEDEGIALPELPRLARLSKRAMRAIVGSVERQGWVVIQPGLPARSSKIVCLTVRGHTARAAWPALALTVAARWRTRCGADQTQALQVALVELVSHLALELPHYPAGYGPADLSITGGHGQDWAAIPRDEPNTAADLPVSALLAQALVAFTMDYEEEAGLSLALSANVIQFLGSTDQRITDIPALVGVAKHHLSALERHGYLVSTRDPADGQTRVRLTARGQRVHASYVPVLAQIEQHWQRHYGTNTMQTLREALERVVSHLDSEPGHYPMMVL